MGEEGEVPTPAEDAPVPAPVKSTVGEVQNEAEDDFDTKDAAEGNNYCKSSHTTVFSYLIYQCRTYLFKTWSTKLHLKLHLRSARGILCKFLYFSLFYEHWSKLNYLGKLCLWACD